MPETAALQLVLGLITALPQATAAISTEYQSIKTAFSADSQAQIEAALAAANAQLDADMTQFDADALAHGATD